MGFQCPSHRPELEDLPEPNEDELAWPMKIVDKLTVDQDLSLFHDGYRERIEALINSKLKGKAVLSGGERNQRSSGQEHDGSAERNGRILEVI